MEVLIMDAFAADARPESEPLTHASRFSGPTDAFPIHGGAFSAQSGRFGAQRPERLWAPRRTSAPRRRFSTPL
jgi:hypothetical protein